MVKLKSYLLILLGLAVVSLSSCSKDAKENPTPTPQANVKPTSRKPGAKPDIANNVKNESAKSSKSNGGQSLNATKGGLKPNFASPASNAQTNKFAAGNASFGRAAVANSTADASISGWAINSVTLLDEADSSVIILFTTDASISDSDEDGEPDINDTDDDNDGTPDAEDGDDDNDGVSDSSDDDDDDNDGIADIDDLDDDGDGVMDDEESDNSTAANTDSDDDGIFDEQDDDDDGDGTADADDLDDDDDGINDDDEDDFAQLSDESIFDFSLFFFSTGEYMIFDPSENEDAWDWGYWYYGQDQSDEYLCFDLGDDDEEVYIIDEESDANKISIVTYDLDSGLLVIIDFDKLALS